MPDIDQHVGEGGELEEGGRTIFSGLEDQFRELIDRAHTGDEEAENALRALYATSPFWSVEDVEAWDAIVEEVRL